MGKVPYLMQNRNVMVEMCQALQIPHCSLETQITEDHPQHWIYPIGQTVVQDREQQYYHPRFLLTKSPIAKDITFA